MTNRRALTGLFSLLGLMMGGSASAQTPPAPAPQPVYVAPPPGPVQPPPPAPMMDAPEANLPVADAAGGASDHDLVIGRYGLEAITVGTNFVTPATGVPMSVSLNAAGVRVWMNRNMAFNADLAFALGSSKTEGPGGMDNPTYFGIGPAGGVTFLLGLWKHLAVSASPQAGLVYFTPGGDNAKSVVLFNLRAQMEAELQLGWIGAPALSLAFTTGLNFNFVSVSDTASAWQLAMQGPTGFWSAITGAAIRFYM